LKGES